MWQDGSESSNKIPKRVSICQSQSLSNFMLQREWGSLGHLIFHPTTSGWHPETQNSPYCRYLFLELVTHNEQGPQLVICLLERALGSWQPAKQAANLGRSRKGVERNVRDLTVNMEWRQWCSYSSTFIFTWWHKKEGEENLLNETWHSLIKVWFRLQQSFYFVRVSVLPHHGQPNRRDWIK